MSEHKVVSMERTDMDSLTGPGLYEITCSCGWKSSLPRDQFLARQEFDLHLPVLEVAL